MLKHLLPQIRRADLPAMVLVTLAGGLIGGVYGIVHDNITYSISPEYFTKLKFHQFQYADAGLGDRFFVSTIGFLATGCVGAIAAWFFARRFLPHQSRRDACRQISWAFACLLAFGFCYELIGFAYGLWRGPHADYSLWDLTLREYRIVDRWSFLRVAYIHNAGYLGAFIGFIVALLTILPRHNVSA